MKKLLPVTPCKRWLHGEGSKGSLLHFNFGRCTNTFDSLELLLTLLSLNMAAPLYRKFSLGLGLLPWEDQISIILCGVKLAIVFWSMRNISPQPVFSPTS